MANKPKTNYTSEIGIVDSRDTFQTPRYATKLLLPYIPNVEMIWECAANLGRMSDVFVNAGYSVFESDIIEYKTGTTNIVNFLTDLIPQPILFEENLYEKRHNVCIVTNPPFSLKKQFAYRCLETGLPWALLIPFDMNGWICDLIENFGVQFILPNRRISYITPSGKQGKESAAQFHSVFMTYGFNLPQQINIVHVTKEMKEEI